MTCDRDQLLLLAAGELDAADARRVERHAAQCPACARALAGLRADFRAGFAALDRLPPLEPSGAAVDRALAAGRQALARRRPVLLVTLHVRRWALLAAAALALVLGIDLARGLHYTRPRSGAQLDQLWSGPAGELADTSNRAADLAESVAADPWTRAADMFVADLGASNLGGQLLDLDESLDLLQQENGGAKEPHSY